MNSVKKTLSTAAEWFMWVLRIINNSVSFLFLLFFYFFQHLFSHPLCLWCTRSAVQWSQACCIFPSWQRFAGCVWRAYNSSGWLSWSSTPTLKLSTWWLADMGSQPWLWLSLYWSTQRNMVPTDSKFSLLMKIFKDIFLNKSLAMLKLLLCISVAG